MSVWQRFRYNAIFTMRASEAEWNTKSLGVTKSYVSAQLGWTLQHTQGQQIRSANNDSLKGYKGVPTIICGLWIKSCKTADQLLRSVWPSWSHPRRSRSSHRCLGIGTEILRCLSCRSSCLSSWALGLRCQADLQRVLKENFSRSSVWVSSKFECL